MIISNLTIILKVISQLEKHQENTRKIYNISHAEKPQKLFGAKSK
jgi:hypothetical protein